MSYLSIHNKNFYYSEENKFLPCALEVVNQLFYSEDKRLTKLLVKKFFSLQILKKQEYQTLVKNIQHASLYTCRDLHVQQQIQLMFLLISLCTDKVFVVELNNNFHTKASSQLEQLQNECSKLNTFQDPRNLFHVKDMSSLIQQYSKLQKNQCCFIVDVQDFKTLFQLLKQVKIQELFMLLCQSYSTTIYPIKYQLQQISISQPILQCFGFSNTDNNLIFLLFQQPVLLQLVVDAIAGFQGRHKYYQIDYLQVDSFHQIFSLQKLQPSFDLFSALEILRDYQKSIFDIIFNENYYVFLSLKLVRLVKLFNNEQCKDYQTALTMILLLVSFIIQQTLQSTKSVLFQVINLTNIHPDLLKSQHSFNQENYHLYNLIGILVLLQTGQLSTLFNSKVISSGNLYLFCQIQSILFNIQHQIQKKVNIVQLISSLIENFGYYFFQAFYLIFLPELLQYQFLDIEYQVGSVQFKIDEIVLLNIRKLKSYSLDVVFMAYAQHCQRIQIPITNASDLIEFHFVDELDIPTVVISLCKLLGTQMKTEDDQDSVVIMIHNIISYGLLDAQQFFNDLSLIINEHAFPDLYNILQQSYDQQTHQLMYFICYLSYQLFTEFIQAMKQYQSKVVIYFKREAFLLNRIILTYIIDNCNQYNFVPTDQQLQKSVDLLEVCNQSQESQSMLPRIVQPDGRSKESQINLQQLLGLDQICENNEVQNQQYDAGQIVQNILYIEIRNLNLQKVQLSESENSSGIGIDCLSSQIESQQQIFEQSQNYRTLRSYQLKQSFVTDQANFSLKNSFEFKYNNAQNNFESVQRQISDNLLLLQIDQKHFIIEYDDSLQSVKSSDLFEQLKAPMKQKFHKSFQPLVPIAEEQHQQSKCYLCSKQLVAQQIVFDNNIELSNDIPLFTKQQCVLDEFLGVSICHQCSNSRTSFYENVVHQFCYQGLLISGFGLHQLYLNYYNYEILPSSCSQISQQIFQLRRNLLVFLDPFIQYRSKICFGLKQYQQRHLHFISSMRQQYFSLYEVNLHLNCQGQEKISHYYLDHQLFLSDFCPIKYDNAIKFQFNKQMPFVEKSLFYKLSNDSLGFNNLVISLLQNFTKILYYHQFTCQHCQYQLQYCSICDQRITNFQYSAQSVIELLISNCKSKGLLLKQGQVKICVSCFKVAHSNCLSGDQCVKCRSRALRFVE